MSERVMLSIAVVSVLAVLVTSVMAAWLVLRAERRWR